MLRTRPLPILGADDVGKFAAFLAGVMAAQEEEPSGRNRQSLRAFNAWLIAGHGLAPGWGWPRCVQELAASTGSRELSTFFEQWDRHRSTAAT